MSADRITLRQLIAKLVANDGDKVLDLPVAFRVYDGHRNSAYHALRPDVWPTRHYPRTTDEQGELRFDVPVSDDSYRLVRERAR